jgi:hypothetical protein
MADDDLDAARCRAFVAKQAARVGMHPIPWMRAVEIAPAPRAVVVYLAPLRDQCWRLTMHTIPSVGDLICIDGTELAIVERRWVHDADHRGVELLAEEIG